MNRPRTADVIYRLIREVTALQDRVRMLEGRAETLVGQLTRHETTFQRIEGQLDRIEAGGKVQRSTLDTIRRLIAEKDGILQAIAADALRGRGHPVRQPVPERDFFNPDDLECMARELRGH